MDSPILEALPAIHVTIIGVIAAFFSAFAIYAYQKVNDAKEKLDSVLKRSQSITAPTSFRFGGSNRFVTSEGKLAWDTEGKQLLHNASSCYSYLDHEEKYGIKRSGFEREPEPALVLSLCDDLFLLLSTIFTTYPFWNNGQINVQGQTENVSKLCNQQFDDSRIKEMQRITGFLCWIWNGNNKSIIRLAQKGMMYEQDKKLSEQKELFEKQCAQMPIDDAEKERIWAQFHLPHINSVTNYEALFIEYFEKAKVVEREVIPVVSQTLTSFTTYNQTFKVKETTLRVINLIVFNLLSGVILPLILLNLSIGLDVDWSSFWVSFFEYFLLLLTMAPYIWVCRYLYQKVKSLDFA
ncbi:hypothetical protein [Pseudoalteromonas piscicida]|uniref:Uncharacterized protein n=1 Tax=Pseudoalteromonas piscicida TaxID=43662 RepID=A0A2A5JJG8_PSEO7|nr:hypothetical protein [Pseudoalteromonas piscicida]PCK29594.1 hypothetical protein CEX98_21990 [Pseudoalteromonas piscicida]